MISLCEREALVKEAMSEHDKEHVRVKDTHDNEPIFGKLEIIEEDAECYRLWKGIRFRRLYYHDVNRFGVRVN